MKQQRRRSSRYVVGSLVLATALAGTNARSLQDIPTVGVGFGSSGGGSGTSASISASPSGSASEIEEELIAALEVDYQVTVVGSVQLGALLCDSLVGAEDAPSLQFALDADETIVADQSSYTVLSGDKFNDGVGRKVWTGVVVDPVRAANEAFPRTVSMTWGEECNVETFLLKVTTRTTSGEISVIKTVPCDAGSSTDICMVEVSLQLEDSSHPLLPPEANGADVPATTPSSSAEDQGRGLHAASGNIEATADAVDSEGRKLQSNTEIDVMVLYTDDGLVWAGGVSAEQMETIIVESMVWTNEAFVNSEVALQFNIVHMGRSSYEEQDTTTLTALYDITDDSEAADLRDTYGADLVQLIGGFSGGRAWLFYFSNSRYGYSVVGANAVDNYVPSHEYGHNLGGHHNREDSAWSEEYSHGMRYCEGTDQYMTIMSYWCGAPLANYFSNPDVYYLNKPTGTPTENNVREFRNNMVAVSNFRTRNTNPTPAPTPSTDGLVDAGTRTRVRASANVHDEEGCSSGCSADLTRDSDSTDDDSRWSCTYDLEDRQCRLFYRFDDAQDIVRLDIAFYAGDERTRSFKVKTWSSNGERKTTSFTSSGNTAGFESFELNSDETVKLRIVPNRPDKKKWLSIKETLILVE